MKGMDQPMTVKCDIVGITTASVKAKLNNHTILIPAHQVKGIGRGELTFHYRKDAMHFYKMTA